ncbi:MAG: hypothetical protein ABJE10_10590 [bacterium]
MDHVEHISSAGRPLAFIIRAELSPAETTFLTPPDFRQQVGFVVYPEGGEIARHIHLPRERQLVGASEVIVVRSGRCELDIYDDDRSLVATRALRTGDVMIMVAGGHGFRMLENTVLLEVKQGPYTGQSEKVVF